MKGILLVILACVFWGMDALIRFPLVGKGIDPVFIVFFEHAVLTLIFSLSLIPAIKRIGELNIADIFSFIVIGAFGSAVATVCFTESFQFLNPSLVILLQKLQPVVAILLAALILKEQIQKQFLIWAGVCLVGGFLISSPDIVRFYHLMVKDFGLVKSDGAVRGYALVGISILGWGASTVFGKRLTMVGYETRAIMGGRFFIGLITLIPFMKWHRGLILSDGTDYARLVAMVLISGVLAMWFYYQGLKTLSAKTTAIAEMFFPFFAVIMNWIFLGQELNQLQLVGGAILIVGSFVIQLKKY